VFAIICAMANRWLALVPLLVVAGCSAEGDPAPTPPSTTVAPAPTVTVTPPAAAAGEVGRSVIKPNNNGGYQTDETFKKVPKGGAAYMVRAACSSPTAGAAATYEVRSGKPGTAKLLSGELHCDGKEISDGFELTEAQPVTANLVGMSGGDITGYALIVPA
jgi:hypothetical protein